MMRTRKSTIAAIGILLAAELMLAADALAQDAPPAPAATEKPRVVGILFYAEWCTSCKVLEPKLDAVKQQVMQQPIYSTRVDMTDDWTKKQSGMCAEWAGFSEIYRENAPKTGFMLLIDPQTRKVLGKLTKTQSEAELRAAMDEALAKTK